MIVKVRENILGFKTVTLKEADDMKCRCTICLMWHGAAVKTEKLKLKIIDGVSYLVCKRHENVDTINRRDYEKRHYSPKAVS